MFDWVAVPHQLEIAFIAWEPAAQALVLLLSRTEFCTVNVAVSSCSAPIPLPVNSAALVLSEAPLFNPNPHVTLLLAVKACTLGEQPLIVSPLPKRISTNCRLDAPA